MIFFRLLVPFILMFSAQAFPALDGQALAKASFKEKMIFIEMLTMDPSDKASKVLQYWLDGELAYWPKIGGMVRNVKEGRKYLLKDLMTGKELETVVSKKIKRVKTNNRLRAELKQVIGFRKIASPDVEVRYAAVLELMRQPNLELLPKLLDRELVEPDLSVNTNLSILIGLTQLESSDSFVQLEGLERITNVLSPEVKDVLNRFLLRGDLDRIVVDRAAEILVDMERQLSYWGMGQNLFYGLSLGSVLLLAAIGLAITFGVMGVINMAHGEFIMLGAYTAFVVQQFIPGTSIWSLIVAIPTAFLVSGFAGIILERSVIRHLYGRPLETLLATVGVSLILQQLVRSVFGPLNQSVITPDLLSGSLNINAAFSMTYNRIFVMIFAIIVLISLWCVMQRTTFGMRIRAVTMNRGMASSMGIPTKRMDAMAFGLGSGIAGMAGVALSQLTNVGPNLGQAYIVDSFMVVVFGGVGNLLGTVVAAFSLGVANKIIEPFSGAVLAKIFILVFIVLFIQKRPRGLFALKGRSVED
jgi:urea transport system permease protein